MFSKPPQDSFMYASLYWIRGIMHNGRKCNHAIQELHDYKYPGKDIWSFFDLTKYIPQTSVCNFTILFHRYWCEYFLRIWSMWVVAFYPTSIFKVYFDFLVKKKKSKNIKWKSVKISEFHQIELQNYEVSTLKSYFSYSLHIHYKNSPLKMMHIQKYEINIDHLFLFVCFFWFFIYK